MHDASKMPQLLSDEFLPGGATACIFVLSNGVFSNPSYISIMLGAATLQVHHIPLIVEDGFRFPSEKLFEEFRENMPALLKEKGVSQDTSDIINLIKMMFNEIAIVFAPQNYSSTEAVLQA